MKGKKYISTVKWIWYVYLFCEFCPPFSMRCLGCTVISSPWISISVLLWIRLVQGTDTEIWLMKPSTISSGTLLESKASFKAWKKHSVKYVQALHHQTSWTHCIGDCSYDPILYDSTQHYYRPTCMSTGQKKPTVLKWWFNMGGLEWNLIAHVKTYYIFLIHLIFE